jgi:predicted TIM-barrel fold metal-dependent hydrolase
MPCPYHSSPPLAQTAPKSSSTTALHLLPAGTWDTHVHVFDPLLGPYSPTRAYTPPNAPLSTLLAFSSSLTTSARPANLVIVQPSPYGTDNAVLLSILQQCQQLNLIARGIAVVNVETVSEVELREMHRLGVRGLRLNIQANGHIVDTATFDSLVRQAADRIKHLPGWKLQIFAPANVWTGMFVLC